ncbi:cytochrome c oxidase subunit 2 [Sanguibacter antarcticus]|uniref:cytochrome-c oxidase n=1 Tax=Sanguibacter antarcticus TaxID=372484 RepID=A0A2A9E1I8_9MICO|nr:cytochrome c oxidase subunit 2 [Sanguibacter antarcticus]
MTERRRVLVTDGNGRFLTLPRRAWCLVGRQGAIRFELSRTKVLGVALFWVKPGRVVKGHPLRSERPTSSRRTIGRLAGAATLVSLAVSGCAPEAQRGFLPGYSDGPTTNQTDTITNMWVGSWTAALVVGVITWALMLWCVVVYRKRRDDNVLPIQTRYHLPLEIMYTMVPIVMVGVLFFFTQRDMSDIRDTSAVPDLTVQVIGKQWSWDFNYLDEGVYETGQHAIEPGTITGDLGGVGTDESFPTLYLPVGQNVEFQIESRDVIHSFWIPAFLDKMDMVPYRTNIWQVTPLREGVYAGKCAELCGDFHSGMLFNVKVVSVEEFDAEMERLADIGQTGQLGLDLNRQQHPESTATTESDN